MTSVDEASERIGIEAAETRRATPSKSPVQSDGPLACQRPEAIDEHPSPAAPEGREDEGQRCAEDMSASEMSDKQPAGLDRYGPLKRHSRTSRNSRSDNLEKPLTVRLSVADREAIWDRARVLGVKPSAWARGVLLDGLDARRSNVDRLHAAAAMKPDPQLAAAVEQVRRVGGTSISP